MQSSHRDCSNAQWGVGAFRRSKRASAYKASLFLSRRGIESAARSRHARFIRLVCSTFAGTSVWAHGGATRRRRPGFRYAPSGLQMDPGTPHPDRFRCRSNGRPSSSEEGGPAVTKRGRGPVYEITPSFRGGRQAEPGIQTGAHAHLDSGFAALPRPGMTE